MPEEFTFEQRLRYRTHIKRDHRLATARRHTVNLPCQQFLSCSILARDEDVRIGHSHTLHDSAYVLHLGTCAPKHRNLAALRYSNTPLALLLCTFESIHQGLHQLLVIPWFDNKVECTMLHRLHGKVNVGICGKQHDLHLRELGVYLLEPEDTLIAGVYSRIEVHVKQQHIRLLRRYCREQRRRRRECHHLRKITVGEQFHRRQNIPVVIDYK